MGEQLVDALKDANERLLGHIRSRGGEVQPGIADVYAELVEEWCGKDVDDTLVSSCLNSARLLRCRPLSPADPCPEGLRPVYVRIWLRARRKRSRRPCLCVAVDVSSHFVRHAHAFRAGPAYRARASIKLATARGLAAGRSFVFASPNASAWGDCRANRLFPDHQKAYLIASLHILIRHLPAPVPPALLAAHVRLLAAHHASLGPGLLPAKADTPEKILRIARKHTSKAPASAAVWLARLGAERQFATQDEIDTAWEEARKHAAGDRIQDVWLWGLESANRHPSEPASRAGTPGAESEAAHGESDVQLLEVSALYAARPRTGPRTDGRLVRSPRHSHSPFSHCTAIASRELAYPGAGGGGGAP